jgi:hypothetical protein
MDKSLLLLKPLARLIGGDVLTRCGRGSSHRRTSSRALARVHQSETVRAMSASATVANAQCRAARARLESS